jgi:hypothetical protein
MHVPHVQVWEVGSQLAGYGLTIAVLQVLQETGALQDGVL